MLSKSIVPTSIGILVLRTEGCQLTGVHLLEIVPDLLRWRQEQGVCVHIEYCIRVVQYDSLTGRNSRCAAQGLNSFFHMATSLPSGKVMGRTRKSKVLLEMSRHSDSFSLKAGIRSCSASIMNCSGLLAKTRADFSMVRASCSLSPHTTTHIVTSLVDGVPGDFFESAKRSLLAGGWSYSLLEKLVVTLSSIMSAVRIRHSKNNLYTDFITSCCVAFYLKPNRIAIWSIHDVGSDLTAFWTPSESRRQSTTLWNTAGSNIASLMLRLASQVMVSAIFTI
ncbi:hypothetical protein ALC60_05111 [Trachymyrmex zeteki]|uniref:Uncharacterized protein n=1 Tax=Mycetomoellerius zeteki TaxID=64791 RepID=A0A151X6G9_9HYME|nr:hypothetical protein ALC60_05111 [Trachymyrmex zeteki]